MSSELRNEKVAYTDDGVVRTWEEVTVRPLSEHITIGMEGATLIKVTDAGGARIYFDLADAEHIGNLLIKKAGEAKKAKAA